MHEREAGAVDSKRAQIAAEKQERGEEISGGEERRGGFRNACRCIANRMQCVQFELNAGGAIRVECGPVQFWLAVCELNAGRCNSVRTQCGAVQFQKVFSSVCGV